MESQGMDQIKDTIRHTVASLSEKRALLVSHRESYHDLKSKLYALDKLSETDSPEVDINLNSVLRVKGKISNPKRVLAYLGTEYFVERDPIESVKIVDNKLKFLNQAILEFDEKIKEAKKTMENIDQLVKHDVKEKEEVSALGKVDDEGQSEGLPFMEIREDLDDDGNVINSVVEPQNVHALKQLTEKHDLSSLGGDENSNNVDELHELLKDMEIIPRDDVMEDTPDVKKIVEIDDESDDLDLKIVERTVINKPKSKESPSADHVKNPINETKKLKSILKKKSAKSNGLENTNKEVKILSPSEPITPVESAEPQTAGAPGAQLPDYQDSEYYKLIRELGITSISGTTPPLITPSVTAKDIPESKTEEESLEQIPTQQDAQQPITSNFSPQIDANDILQLQIIDSEIGEYSDFEEDEDGEFDDYEEGENEEINMDEFDFEFDHDQEDDEDWGDFGPNEVNLIPGSHKDLFTSELSKLRSLKNVKVGASDSRIEELDTAQRQASKVGNRKKSVQFAEELEHVKEIENVSEQLKEALNVHVSKFKQSRGRFNAFTPSVARKSDDDVAVNEKVIETVIDTIVEDEVVEKEKDEEEELDEIDESERAVSEFIVENEVEAPVVVAKTSKKPSRFKTSFSSKPVSTPVSETFPVNAVEEIAEKPTRQSKFKSTLNSKPSPVPEVKEAYTDSKSDPVNDEPIQLKKQSRFKSSRKTSQDSATSVINEIESKAAQTAEETQDVKPKKQSKFKSSLSSLTKRPTSLTNPISKDGVDKNDSIMSDITEKNSSSSSTIISIPTNEPLISPDIDFESIRSYVIQEVEEEEDEELLNNITDEISVYRGDDDNNNDDDYDEDDDDYGAMILDEIVENEDVDDPDYFVNDSLLRKEYNDLRRTMMEKYAEKNEYVDDGKDRVRFKEDEDLEFEPIDENGNPIKVSRFRKSLEK
jgi:prefoldin alpha subunit